MRESRGRFWRTADWLDRLHTGLAITVLVILILLAAVVGLLTLVVRAIV